MVVKESSADWKQKNEFFGPKKDIPREHYMSMVLPKGSKNTVNVMGSRLFRERNCFRLYMEYCPGGDVSRLWESYSNLSLAFPEPYLWKLFQDLARAVHAMDNPSGHGLEGGEAIAHIDFKPENIFLCLPDESGFPKYPVGKLADFGGAIVCSPRDKQKVHAKKVSECKLIGHQQMVFTLLTLFEGAVSPGYIAPDVERFFKNNRAEIIPARDARPGVTIADIPKRVTTATNVWNAGLIILDLMSRQHFVPPVFIAQAYTDRETWLDNTINQLDTDPRLKGYSKLLKDTVIQCINYDPTQRPTPENLLARVDLGVNSHCGVMQTKDCLDAKKYSGQYDLDPRLAFSDDYPITQKSDEWTMADGGADNEEDDDNDDFPFAKRGGGGGSTPTTPHGKAQARPSYSTKAGAPQDTPFKGFVFGPNAGMSTRNFFDAPDEDYEMVDRPEPRHDFFKKSEMREAMEDGMPDRQDGRPEPRQGFVQSSQLRQAMEDEMMGG